MIVIRGDARALPLPDGSVDLVVTSPPYFGLRSYTDGGEHYDGQVGSEATPAEFIAALLSCTREWVRVLKPGGSLFVNLGDKYAGGGGFKPDSPSNVRPDANRPGSRTASTYRQHNRTPPGAMPKSLLGLPWRYALGCTDQLGLILRSEIVWAKPNGLPESVTDRVRRSHEQVFHFTRLPRYYAAVDEIREAYSEKTVRTYPTPYGAPGTSRHGKDSGSLCLADNPLGKLPGSVWDIPSQPLTVPDHLGVDHFAAFPMELPRRIILGWSPPGVCTGCGEGRRPVSASQITADRGGRQFNPASGNIGVLGKERVYRITGYACACPAPDAPTRPAVVLDPFGGTGTTATVASALGRTGVTVDRSADYCRLAAWRTHDPGQRAAAMQVPKPPPVPDGQLGLFGLAGEFREALGDGARGAQRHIDGPGRR